MGSASAASVADITALMRSGKQAEAMTQLEAGLKKDPQDPQLRFAKGVIFTEQRKTQEAIAIFLKLSEEYPNLPEPYNNLAVLYTQDNQFEKARAALHMAIKTNASYATAYENLGDVHARMAAQAYDKALNLNSNGDVKSKLAVLHTLGIPATNKVAVVAPAAVQANAPVTSSVASPVSTPTGAAAVATNTSPATSAADLEKRPAADKAAVAAAIAAARQAAAEKNAAQATVAQATTSAPAPRPAPTTQNPTVVAAAPTVIAQAQPTAPAPIIAKPAPAISEQESVLSAISSWSRAWASRDMDGYLNAYAPGFKGAAKSHAAWAAERKIRIMGKSSIQVTVEQPVVQVQGDTATAKFRQIYVGGAVQSDGMKTLAFKKAGAKWQITNEISTD